VLLARAGGAQNLKAVDVRNRLIDALRLDLVGPDNESDLDGDVLPQANRAG
jgi:hypothetical protein